MVKILIYIKHHLSFIWTFIEWCNAVLFNMLYGRKLKKNLAPLMENPILGFECKKLEKGDMQALETFFEKQPESAYTFFKPHGFDLKSLQKKNKDKSFIMIGLFDKERIVGYCFLRCFFNKQSFRGKIVDVDYQGRGIAKQMGILTTSICAALNFRLFATISKDNVKSIASSKAVNEVKILKELPDDYLYVEYLLKK